MILVVGSARRPLSLVSVRCTEGLRQVYRELELDGVSMDRDVAGDLCRSRELDRRHTSLHLSQSAAGRTSASIPVVGNS